MKHTPGPWIIIDKDGDVIPIDAPVSSTGYDESMEVCVVSSQDEEAQEANALLISSAPDMLEALKYVVRYHRENDSGEGELFGLDYVTTCIMAIHKAEGR